MKKTILILSVALLGLTSCTDNSRVKNWGGESTMNLPENRKLINVTWKESQIWYLTRQMDSNDVAETYKFQEESSWGVLEGTYTIVETKTK